MSEDSKAIAQEDLMLRVDRALDYVRPHMAVDGGNVELVEITDEMIVKIRWMGACKNCDMTLMTLRAGLEETVRNRVPEILGVEAITQE